VGLGVPALLSSGLREDRVDLAGDLVLGDALGDRELLDEQTARGLEK